MNIDRYQRDNAFGPSPVLLLGMPRSGTTWIGKIFDSHPDTVYRHEPDTWRPMTPIPLIAERDLADEHCGYVRDYLSDVVNMRAERVCAKQPTFPKRYMTRLRYAAYRAGAGLSKLAARGNVEFPVMCAPRMDRANSWRLVWKSIESLGRLGLLQRCLPEARVVHIVRHPCGYVSSIVRGEQAGRFTHGGAAEDYGIFGMLCETPQARRRGLTVAQLGNMSPCERLAWRWVLFNEHAAEAADGSPGSTRLYYEQLCAAPADVARDLFHACDLSWDPQTDAFLTASTRTARADYYSVFKDPLASAWRWQESMRADDVSRVLAIARQSRVGAAYFEDRDWTRKLDAA